MWNWEPDSSLVLGKKPSLKSSLPPEKHFPPTLAIRAFLCQPDPHILTGAPEPALSGRAAFGYKRPSQLLEKMLTIYQKLSISSFIYYDPE